MMCKVPCSLVIVATLIVLVAGDCIDVASRSKPGRSGGYQPIKNPEKDDVVKKIVADSIEFENNRVNEINHFKDDDHYVAYRQVVKGHHYCCQFQMLSRDCTKSGEIVKCEYKKKRTCSVEAYQDIPASFATIDIKTLHCSGVPNPT